MGRPELPLDPADGPRPAFAAQLRQLRQEAGLPTYRTMAARAGYSAAALSRAAAGARFPTLEVTLAFVRACDGDAAEWQLRWRQARDLVTSILPAEVGPRPENLAETAAPSRNGPASRSRPPAGVDGRAVGQSARWRPAIVALGAAGVLAVALLSVLVIAGGGRGSSPAATGAADTASHPVDGADPYVSRCAVDQTRIEQRAWPVRWPGRGVFGQLVLFYSHQCHASWGYVYGPNSPEWTVVIITQRLGMRAASTTASFRGTAPPNFWGNLLSDHDGCVRAEAFVMTDSARGPATVTGCWQENGPVQHGTSPPIRTRH
jgi:transcriptional regulator with XRE-family HTH domain